MGVYFGHFQNKLKFVPLLLLIITTCSNTKQLICNKIKIGDKFYDKEVLWEDIPRPTNLNVFKATNTLFFSYSTAEMFSESDFQLATFNLEKKERHYIIDIVGGCAIAIDQSNDKIYLGGSDGIYTYDKANGFGKFYQQKGKHVWSLFHRNHLFYVSYPEQKLHMSVERKFSIVQEFKDFEIDVLHITSNGEIYFGNKTGFYSYDSGIKQADVITEMVVVRQICEDIEENIYVVTNYGIYKGRDWKKVSDANNIHGMVFDKDDNIIISDERSIIKLLPSVVGCYSRIW